MLTGGSIEMDIYLWTNETMEHGLSRVEKEGVVLYTPQRTVPETR
jgi:hypothetical protein